MLGIGMFFHCYFLLYRSKLIRVLLNLLSDLWHGLMGKFKPSVDVRQRTGTKVGAIYAKFTFIQSFYRMLLSKSHNHYGENQFLAN